MKTPLTPERLAEIATRFEAARPKEDRGGAELNMSSVPDDDMHHAAAYYGDGDLCAEIFGNLGLDVDGDALAEFFAHALVDVRDMLEEIERLREGTSNETHRHPRNE